MINGLTLLWAIIVIAAVAIAVIGLRALFHDPGEHARPFREPLPLAPPPRRPAPPPTSLAPFPPAEWPGTAAAAVPAPGLPPLPEPVPQVDHDEFGPDQFFHYGPPDPAAAVEDPPGLPPPPAHHTAVAVGAMIAATAAHIAGQERARAAELEAEAWATRPWIDETGSFALETLRAYEAVK